MLEEPKPREVSIRDFLRVVFKQKWILITLFTVSTLVVAIMNIKSPVLYESQARVLVRRGQVENVVYARYRYLPWEEEISSELETVKSQAVLARARDIMKEKLEEAGLHKPPTIARSSVSVEVVKESNVLAISFLDRDPDIAQMGADAVTHAYMEYYQKAGDVARVDQFFQREIQSVEGQLEGLRADRGEFLESENLTFSPDEKKQLEDNIDSDKKKLDEIRGEIKKRETALGAQRKALEEGSMSRVPRVAESSYGDDSVLLQAKLELFRLKADRDAMAAQYTDKYPPLMAIDKQIAVVEGEIRTEIENKISLEELDLEILREQERSVSQSLGQSEEKLRSVVDNEGHYQQMELDLETLADRYKQLKDTEIQSKITQATSPDWRVTLLVPASKAIPRNTKDYVRMALAPVFSVVIGLGLAFFFESLDHSIKGPADVEEALGLPVLASLWMMKKS
jgi:succinoglycan biosynthesis transport protein ExoP